MLPLIKSKKIYKQKAKPVEKDSQVKFCFNIYNEKISKANHSSIELRSNEASNDRSIHTLL